MDLKLKGKTAFISGSTAGIGFGVAKSLIEEGAHVIINGRSDRSVEGAIKKLQDLFPEAEIKGEVCDFSKEKEVNALANRLKHIDILINNVGIYSSQSFYDTSDKDWKQQIEVNIMSGVRLSKAVLPEMIEREWGRILFISSECATLVPEDLIAYSTTKTAILGISRGLAQLTKGTGVTVNTIIPGSTMTEGAAQFLQNLAEKENKTVKQAEIDFFENIRTSSLLQRFIDVDEVANTVVYFSSPLSAATNGTAIKVDGGSMGGLL